MWVHALDLYTRNMWSYLEVVLQSRAELAKYMLAYSEKEEDKFNRYGM